MLIITQCVFSIAQWCPTLCNPMDCSPPGSSAHGIFQARILEWVGISSSRVSFWPRDQTHVSCVSCTAGGFFTTEPPGKPYKIGMKKTEAQRSWQLKVSTDHITCLHLHPFMHLGSWRVEIPPLPCLCSLSYGEGRGHPESICCVWIHTCYRVKLTLKNSFNGPLMCPRNIYWTPYMQSTS